MVAQPAGPRPAPATIEDFLFYLHTALVAEAGPLAVDAVRDAYAKHLGHKCVVERWLVVNEAQGGLAATLKRIPHVVTIFQANGTTCIKATQPAGTTKEGLMEADKRFRAELQKKIAAAKSAKAGAPPAEAPEANGFDIAKNPKAPFRPPATMEDFLFYLHTVLEACTVPLPIDHFKDAYSKHLGHKCAIERFLVVGDVGLVGTLKRIPHVVTLVNDNGQVCLKPTLPKGSTVESLKQADLDYRNQLKAKAAAAKSAAKSAPPAAAGQTRPSEGGGEPDGKRQKGGDDSETLSRMLVQGVVRVLQHRAKEGKGPLAVSELPDEFKALWKVPFNLQSAGFSDVDSFLESCSNKVELSADGLNVSLVKKVAPEAATAPPAAKVAEAPATAKKAVPAVPQIPPKAPPPATVTAEVGEPDAKKPKTQDMDTLSRMLVQGVVRVLQGRAKEGKPELLLSSLAEEFKALWKVPFNLQSAGYTDVNAFLKAWPNKVELVATPEGDAVSLAKKPTEKAATPAPVTAAKSVAPNRPTAQKAAPPKPAVPVASPTSSQSDAKATSPAAEGIPSTMAELHRELARNVQDLDGAAKRQQALFDRQKALIEALGRSF